MRIAAAVIVWASCAHAPPPVAVPTPPADLKSMSHAVIDAFDHGDLAAYEQQLATSFVHVEEGNKPTDRAHDLEILKKRDAHSPHVAERTWTEENVLVTGDQAAFVGHAAERSSGGHGGYTFDGRYTLVWRFVDGAWKLASWTWAAVPEDGEAVRWNRIFKHGTGFEKQPNKLLVETLKTLKPGTALDLASGQGRNVLYEASQGWKATAIDISHEGLEQTRAGAKERGLTVDTIEADLDTAELGTAKYDLVSMLYAGADAKQLAKAKAALKPGGVFVFEYFAAGVGKMEGPAPGELAKAFDGFEILKDEVVEDTPDWAMDRAKLQRFVARKR